MFEEHSDSGLSRQRFVNLKQRRTRSVRKQITKKQVKVAIGALATVALVVTGSVWLATDLSNRRTVPDLIGQTEESAMKLVTDLELRIEIDAESGVRELDDEFTNVTQQVPVPGETLYRGDKVVIEVSAADVAVPNVVGETYGDAVISLRDASFAIQHNFGANTPESGWKVLEQKSKAGTEIPAGSTVSIVVDAPPVVVPNVVGMSVVDAQVELRAGRLGSVESGEGDHVRSVDPAPGSELAPFSDVTIVLGYKVPDVVGMTAPEAIEALEEAGFTNVERTHDSDLKVSKQSVAAGTITSGGIKIVLTVPLSGTTYRVTGNGSSALITWSAPDSFSIQQDGNAALPWEKHFASSGGFANFSAQVHGGTSITCTVIRDGEVVMEHTSTGLYAVVSCAG